MREPVCTVSAVKVTMMFATTKKVMLFAKKLPKLKELKYRSVYLLLQHSLTSFQWPYLVVVALVVAGLAVAALAAALVDSLTDLVSLFFDKRAARAA